MSDWAMRVYAKSCEQMSEIPDASVQACVTSPPYFGLRDYGVPDQIGLERTIEEYVQRLVGVFREVRRVLRADGTLWLNLGDSYATHIRGSDLGWDKSRLNNPGRIQKAQLAALVKRAKMAPGLKEKDLIGVPWTVAFALRADGWWLRDAIVWHKPNPMPSSVKDRCTPSYEMVFMLSKSARYYADMESVREPLAESTLERISQAKWKSGEQAGSTRANGGAKKNGPMRCVIARKGKTPANPVAHEGLESGWDWGARPTIGANLRNVWTISTTPYSDAHFATFPLELPLRCISIASRPGDVILDPFMGSGATAQAAESIGRKWVGYELNPEYQELIAERTRQAGLFSA